MTDLGPIIEYRHWKYHYKEVKEKYIKITIKFNSEEIANKVAKKYLEFRIFITIKIDKNKLEIVYPSDSWGSDEEIDNEFDIIESWIENGEI